MPAGLPVVSVHSTLAASAPEDMPKASRPAIAAASGLWLVRNFLAAVHREATRFMRVPSRDGLQVFS